jgi:hypothetical protein
MISKSKNISFLAERVCGEMLYNQYQNIAVDSSLLYEANSHLKAARSIHPCGARSDVISDLMTR